MRLQYFKLLTPFRGLPAGFEIDLTRPPKSDPVEPICLVGLNGSGKSNIMQALAQTFYYLSCINHPEASNYPAFTQDLRFILRYELLVTPDSLLTTDDPVMLRKPTMRQIRFSREEQEQPPVAAYKYDPGEHVDWLVLTDILLIDKMLPRYVIGYSSGQNELISNPFIQMDFLYYQNMKEAVKGNQRRDVNRMFFMDYHINAMALIINYINKEVDTTAAGSPDRVSGLQRGAIDTLDEVIGIDDVTSFSITMNLKVKVERSLEEIEELSRKVQTEGLSSLSLDFFRRYVELPSELLLFVQNLIRVSTTVNDVSESLPSGRRIKLVMYFRLDNEMRRAFQDTFRGTVKDFFQSLYLLNLLNINLYSDEMQQKVLNSRYKISINGFLPRYSTEEKVFHIDDIKLTKGGVEIDYKNLSDGEHQFMHVTGTLMLLDDAGTLFLLDEPETHFNPEWRSLFISTLNKVVSKDRDHTGQLKSNMDIVMTTHSPFILSDCRRESIFIFKRNEQGNVAFSQPMINTYGSSSQILLQEIFGKSSSISKMTEQKLDEMRAQQMDSEDQIKAIRENVSNLGDSVEKFMLLVKLQKETEKLEKK